MAYHLYILQSEPDGSYYVGTTNNLEDRINRHNEGRVKYTKPKRPWKLVYSEAHTDRSSAMKREYEIKSHKRKEYIKNLIQLSSTGG
jgi:putative endonuclease